MNSIIAFIDKYRKSNPTGWRKWILGSIVTVLVVVVLTVYSVLMKQRSSEIMRLQHEKDVLQAEVRSAVVNSTLDDLTEKQKLAVESAARASVRVEEINDKLSELRNTHSSNRDIINSLRSWSDVDAKIK